jgi:hypothetical protein
VRRSTFAGEVTFLAGDQFGSLAPSQSSQLAGVGRFLATLSGKVSGRASFRKRRKFGPHFKGRFSKHHLRVRILAPQPILKIVQFQLLSAKNPIVRLQPAGTDCQAKNMSSGKRPLDFIRSQPKERHPMGANERNEDEIEFIHQMILAGWTLW